MNGLRRTVASPAARGSVLAGCLITLGVLFVLIAIGVVYAAMTWRGYVASWTMQGTKALLAESNMAPEQKQAITAEIEALANDFKEKRVSLEEMGRVIEALTESPLLPLTGVQVAKEKYVDPSTMTPEEKAAAERSLQRFARGIYEKKITPPDQQITDALKPIAVLDAGGGWKLKENPTRKEIDQFIANCKEKADEAKIPDEPFEIDFAAELKQVIASARAGASKPPPAPATKSGESGGSGGG
jgi:hypothetical protein